jgi:hypothetical protein
MISTELRLGDKLFFNDIDGIKTFGKVIDVDEVTYRIDWDDIGETSYRHDDEADRLWLVKTIRVNDKEKMLIQLK